MPSADRPRRRPPWISVAASAGLMALAAALLLAMGRTPWYRGGPVKGWYGNAWGPENSQQLTDPYTLTHLTHGALIYLLLRLVARRRPLADRFVLAVAIESAWEVMENTNLVIERYRAATMALGYYGDSVINSMGDIVACMLGFALAARLPARWTVALIVGLEAVLLFWIHDSLLLNIVMLIYPIEAVKNWQLGQ